MTPHQLFLFGGTKYGLPILIPVTTVPSIHSLTSPSPWNREDWTASDDRVRGGSSHVLPFLLVSPLRVQHRLNQLTPPSPGSPTLQSLPPPLLHGPLPPTSTVRSTSPPSAVRALPRNARCPRPKAGTYLPTMG